jgi:hypothetical protein
MISLPLELCYSFCRYLNHRDYMCLSRTCKQLSYLHKIQFLYFKAYKQTIDIYGQKLRGITRIRLDSQSICDESFMCITYNGHCDEFVRLFQINACNQVSLQAKEFALS